jgi:hypothetical protein
MSVVYEGDKLLGPPKWDGDTSTIDTWLERMKFFMLSTKEDDRILLGPPLIRSMDPNSKQSFVASKMKDSDITGKDGALRVAMHIRNQLAMTTIQDAAVAFKTLARCGVEEVAR